MEHLFSGLKRNETKKNYLHILYNGKRFDGSIEELCFQGEDFHTVKIASYVSGYRYPVSILKNIRKSYLLLGLDEGIGTKLVFDTAILQEAIQDAVLRQLLREDRLDIRFIGPEETLHSKIYLCEGEKIKRVAVGSANFTEAAFRGKQYEELLVFDDEEIFSIYESRFAYLWSISVPALPDGETKKKILYIEFVKDKPEGAETVQILESNMNITLERLKEVSKILMKESSVPVSRQEMIENLKLDIEEQKETLQNEMRSLEISEKLVESIKPKREGDGFEFKNKEKLKEKLEPLLLYKNKKVQETLPERQFFVWERNILYRIKPDGSPVSLLLKENELDKETLKKALVKLENFLKFYNIYATNKLDGNQSRKGFEVILYSFTVPFLWKIRKEIKENFGDEKVARIPAFLIIGGHADSGKSKLLDFVSRLTGTTLYMYKTHIETRGERILEGLFTENNVAPLLVDEIESKFWRSSSSEVLIKEVANTRIDPHTCLVGATNSLREQIVKPEIVKRVYFINFSNPMPKGREFERQAIEYYHREVGEVDDYLMRLFVTLFAKKYPDIPEESLIYLVSDPLYLSREVFQEIYSMASRPVPDIFPERGFYDDFFEPGVWRTIYITNKEHFLPYREGKETFFIVDIAKIVQDPSIQKVVTSRLPNNIVRSQTGRLVLHKEEFLNFIGVKENVLERMIEKFSRKRNS